MSTFLTDLLGGGVAQRVGWALVHFLWQGLAVAVLLAILLQLLGRRSPQARYLAACLALALLTALPMLTAFVITPVPTAHSLAARTPSPIALPAPDPGRDPKDTKDLKDAEPVPVSSSLPVSPPNSSVSSPSSLGALSDLRGESLPSSWLFRLQQTLLPFLPWALVAWLVGVTGLALWHLSGWLLLQRIRGLAVPPAAAGLCDAFARLLPRLAISRPVRLLESALVKVPLVIGWLRPVVLLPAGVLSGLTAAQLEAILAHELAHIRRWDCLVRMVQAAIETLLFYHPAVWWVSGRIRQSSEECCDQLAVALCGDRHGYAEALAVVSGACRPSTSLTAAASGGRLLPRLRRILGLPEVRSFPKVRSALAALVVVLALAFSVTLHVRAGAPGQNPTPAPTTWPADPALLEIQQRQACIRLAGEIARSLPPEWIVERVEAGLVCPDNMNEGRGWNVVFRELPPTVEEYQAGKRASGTLSLMPLPYEGMYIASAGLPPDMHTLPQWRSMRVFLAVKKSKTWADPPATVAAAIKAVDQPSPPPGKIIAIVGKITFEEMDLSDDGPRHGPSYRGQITDSGTGKAYKFRLLRPWRRVGAILEKGRSGQDYLAVFTDPEDRVMASDGNFRAVIPIRSFREQARRKTEPDIRAIDQLPAPVAPATGPAASRIPPLIGQLGTPAPPAGSTTLPATKPAGAREARRTEVKAEIAWLKAQRDALQDKLDKASGPGGGSAHVVSELTAQRDQVAARIAELTRLLGTLEPETPAAADGGGDAAAGGERVGRD